MRIDRDPRGQGPAILGFGPGGFRIDDAVYPAALVTIASAQAWTPPPLDALSVAHLQLLIDEKPELILLGTGTALIRPPHDLVEALEAQGIGLEPMDSKAAARAWGVLRGEGREIAAALYPLT